MTKALLPNLVVFASFWILTFISYKADRTLVKGRSRREWALDLGGLIVQGVFVPLVQVFILLKVFTWAAPNLQGQLALAAPLGFLLNFVLVDYLYYWNHRLLHRPLFWGAHAVHHSTQRLDPIATSRNTLWSPILILYLWVNGAALFLLKDPFWFLMGAAFTAALDIWRHSFVFAQSPQTKLGRLFSRFLITPQDHAWHHSKTHADFNFGANLKFWDKIHGTYSRRRDTPNDLGIATNWSLTQELLGFVPKSSSSSTVFGRLMAFFPLLTLILSGTSAVLAILQLSPWLALASLFFLYGFPPLAFRLHNIIFPLETGLSRLSGTKYSPWWGGHQIQLLYIAIPSLESVLRLVPGLYSLWLKSWGSRIGRGVYWTPQIEITDRSLLDVGNNVIMGHKCAFYSHVVNPRKDKVSLFVERITIGDGVFMGAGSRIGPGATIDAGVILPVLTDVRVNEQITSEMIFDPSEKINSLPVQPKPKEPVVETIQLPKIQFKEEVRDFAIEIDEIELAPATASEGAPALTSMPAPASVSAANPTVPSVSAPTPVSIATPKSSGPAPFGTVPTLPLGPAIDPQPQRRMTFKLNEPR